MINFEVSTLLPVLDVAYPFIIPAFLGYLLAGPASLRLWIAVKQTPLPDAQKPTKLWKKIALTVFFLTVVLGLEFAAFLFASESQLITGFTTLFAFVYGHLLIRFIGDISGVTQRSAHRLPSGAPVFVPIRQARTAKQIATRIGFAVIGAIITANAFFTGGLLSVTVVSSSVISALLSRFTAKNASFRSLIFTWLSMIFVMISSIVIIGFTVNNSSSSNDPESPFTRLMMKSAFGGAFDTLIKRYAWVYTPMYALIPGTLVAISYRFDYQNHLDTTDTADQFILATIPAPELKCGKILGDGVIIPHRAPSSFPKVYYTTSLVAFAFSQILLAVALAYTDCVQLTNSFEFGSLAMFVDIPIICFSLMAMATIRGEWKAFWSYTEAWVVKADSNAKKSIEDNLP